MKSHRSVTEDFELVVSLQYLKYTVISQIYFLQSFRCMFFFAYILPSMVEQQPCPVWAAGYYHSTNR